MIEKTFTVVSVESFFDGVLMRLQPIGLTPDRVRVAPMPRTEEEKVGMEVAKTMIQVVKSELGPSPQFMPPPVDSPFGLRLYLNKDEYESLKKPTVNDTILLQVEVKKEG